VEKKIKIIKSTEEWSAFSAFFGKRTSFFLEFLVECFVFCKVEQFSESPETSKVLEFLGITNYNVINIYSCVQTFFFG